jgi:hypothetical protein
LILFEKDQICDSFHESSQRLAATIQPSCKGPETRHDEDWSDDDPFARVMRYNVTDSDRLMEERKGVIHIVQGWIQQGQKNKVCLKLLNL